MSSICSEPKIISPTHTFVRTLFALVGRKAVSLNTQIRYAGVHNEMAQVQGEIFGQNDLTDPIQRKFHIVCAAINKTARVSPSNENQHSQFLSAEFTATSFTVSIRHANIPLLTEVVAKNMGILKSAAQELYLTAGL